MSAPPHWPLIPLHPPARFTPWGRSLGAFTLVELLVVIAILAVLAAIAIPVLGGMAEKGNSVKCVNNLRQIGGAIQQYSAENNGFFPYSSGPSYEGKGNSYTFSTWQAPLAYYLGIGQLSPSTRYTSMASYDNPTAKHPFNCPSCKTKFRTYTANKYAMGFLLLGDHPNSSSSRIARHWMARLRQTRCNSMTKTTKPSLAHAIAEKRMLFLQTSTSKRLTAPKSIPPRT
jgi:prepilin-type N-terminal cleavage/methylation domain-containing protein